MHENIFERFLEFSMQYFLSSPRYPIPGSFYVDWAKEDKSL